MQLPSNLQADVFLWVIKVAAHPLLSQDLSIKPTHPDSVSHYGSNNSSLSTMWWKKKKSFPSSSSSSPAVIVIVGTLTHHHLQQRVTLREELWLVRRWHLHRGNKGTRRSMTIFKTHRLGFIQPQSWHTHFTWQWNSKSFSFWVSFYTPLSGRHDHINDWNVWTVSPR